MPPILALLLCVIFVIFLLWLEHKQCPDVSRALWLPTIWILYIASKPLGIWFPSSGGDPDMGSPLDRAFLIFLIGVALVLLIRKRLNWADVMKQNIWLVILIVFMLVSVLWSRIPYISFKRWTRELPALLMAFAVLSEFSPRQAIESILRRSIYILIPFSILLIKYFSEYGIEFERWSGKRMWIGVAFQKNGLARLCIISAFFLIWSLVGRRQRKKPPVWKYETKTELLILVITLWLLGGPGHNVFYSATSFYALCLGLLFYWGLNLTKKHGLLLKELPLMIIGGAIILFGIIVIFTGGANLGSAASAASRDATLTGRTEVWASLLPVAMKHPLLGVGFGGFWTSATREYFRISGAHNGYLDVILELGFVGIFLLAMFFLSSCKKAAHELSHEFDWGVLWICYIIMCLVHNIGESSINAPSSQLTAIIIFLTVSSTKRASHREEYSEVEPS